MQLRRAVGGDLPISPYISLYLPISPVYLPISPYNQACSSAALSEAIKANANADLELQVRARVGVRARVRSRVRARAACSACSRANPALELQAEQAARMRELARLRKERYAEGWP